MKIALINSKGGVGKTPLAFSIAKDLNLDLQTNDNSVVTQIYSKAAFKDPCELKDNCVYDFGGFVAAGVLKILDSCDFIIMPVTPKINSVFKACETFNQIKGHIKGRIIVLITDLVNQADLEVIVKALKEAGFGDNVEYFILKHSAAFENAISNAMSFTELYNQNGLSRSQYKSFYDHYNKILEFIKKGLRWKICQILF